MMASTASSIELHADEGLLTGCWIIQDGKAHGNATCERIDGC
jgi:hypothetical protein